MSVLLLIGLVIAAGVVAGLAAGLMGVGGGIIIVPALFYLFSYFGLDVSVAMPLAVGTSLSTIIFTSVVSATSHHRRGNVDWKRVRSWAPLMIIGASLGAWFASMIGGHTLKMLFGIFLLIVSVHIWFRAQGLSDSSRSLSGNVLWSFIPVGVGCLSAILGIGGGLMLVPILQFFSYMLHRAVGSAAAFGAVAAVPGTLTYVVVGWGNPSLPEYSSGYVNWLAFLLIAMTTVVFTPMGVRLSYHLKVPTIKRIFALFAFIMGLRMVIA